MSISSNYTCNFCGCETYWTDMGCGLYNVTKNLTLLICLLLVHYLLMLSRFSIRNSPHHHFCVQGTCILLTNSYSMWLLVIYCVLDLDKPFKRETLNYKVRNHEESYLAGYDVVYQVDRYTHFWESWWIHFQGSPIYLEATDSSYSW
jgi:hypothetical protein